ncbi:type II toxin-antitoxin system VapC family toxin [Brevibacterium litoralis]|uniref:type II toxin-antitoxin system VapC family toxin n=1 Tax=Brevibacterium litoralis TaxID=3138935 RepID=UPI0032ED03E8
MIVVDTSVLIELLGDDEPSGIEGRIVGHRLVAPELVDLEFLHVVRRMVLSGALSTGHGSQWIDTFCGLPLQRFPHGVLIPRIWQLRDNVTPHDAAYVALAEVLDVPLLTGDARLAAAPGVRCRIDLLE